MFKTTKFTILALSFSIAASGASATELLCPDGYIPVPTKTFCVMKYEAKESSSGKVISTASGIPWVYINREAARLKCKEQGAGFDLISNEQWQTIARDIALEKNNWSSGNVASGELNRGHENNVPANALAASDNDNNACFGTVQTCSLQIWNSQRRTHTLSNGSVIWDFAGNVWEWVTNDITVAAGLNGFISTLSNGDTRQETYGAIPKTLCESPNTSPYCGMGHGYFNSNDGAICRGGDWDYEIYAGVFATNLYVNATSMYNSLGFRCVYAF